MNPIRFRVEGTPVVEGNLRRNPNGGLYHQRSADLDAWREAIAWTATAARIGPVVTGAVCLELVFVLPRPQRPKALEPISRPDWDKLARAVSDALTGILYVDDSQVVQASVVKRYAQPGEPPGVVVECVRFRC